MPRSCTWRRFSCSQKPPLSRASRSWRPRVLLEKIPVVVLGLAGAAVAYYAQNANAFLTPLQHYPLTARIGMAFYSLWFYASKTVAPQALGPLYELPARVNPLDWPFLGPALAVTVLTAALVALRRRWPAGLAVWMYYAIALGPVIGIVHSGYHLAKTHYHMGFINAVSGNFPAAVEAYKSYLARYPNDVDALNNLSAALLSMHRPAEALVQIERALKLKPKHIFPNTNLGYVLADLDRRDEALKQFRHAIELKFDNPHAWYGLIRVFLETGRPDAARTAHGILGMFSPQMAKQIGPVLLTTW